MAGVQNSYQGLGQNEAEARLERFGRNEIEKTRKFSMFKLFFSQFTSPLIYILLFAALVTFFLKDFVDMWVILAAVGVNTTLGFYQEFKAQRSLEALAEVLTQKAIVLRDGERVEIDARELVPGDLAILSRGEKVPADGVVVNHKHLMMSEAILTGESQLVAKKALSKFNQEDLEAFVAVGEREERGGKESVYMGTLVEGGLGEMVVVRTGGNTEVGKIARRLSETKEEPTPLQKRLKQFSRMLTVIVGVVAVALFLVGLSMGISFEEIFTLSVAVAVAAIPEGLAVALTAILAIGMRRVLKKKALVRKLLAAEVLGSVSTICADKTGTITEGVMRVTQVETVDEKQMILAALLANDLKDPLEVAMWEWAKKEVTKGTLGKQEGSLVDDIVSRYELIDQMPFRAEKRYAAKLFKNWVFVIGAPEGVLGFTKLTKKEKVEWQEKISESAKKGLRIVGFAYKGSKGRRQLSAEWATRDLKWLGILAYEDPVRKGVGAALNKTYQAGIDVKVITGDYKETARAVMEKLGWKLEDSHIMEGVELERMNKNELQRRVKNIGLFARITPDQKLKIVDALQARGEVVAMTGDGVNDAPALKKADIGIVVSSASDVSKETADMVLLDNNFSTILAAVEEGRGIFENLRKIILYLLSDSFTEVILVLGSLMLGLPLPVTAAQILWVNLIDDGLPSLALTLDPKDKDLLKRKIRKREEPLMGTEVKLLVGLISVVTAVMILIIFSWYVDRYGIDYARTMTFTILGVDSLLYVFSSRSLRRPIWHDGLLRNKWLVGAVIVGFLIQLSALYLPFLQRVFKTHALPLSEWLVVFASGIVVIGLIEGVKWLFMRFDTSAESKF